MELNTITVTGRLIYAITLTASLTAAAAAEDTESAAGREGEITNDYVGE